MRTRRMPRVLMTAAIIALSAAGVMEAQAANYYVALSGSDGNPGTQAAPFRTINHALSVVGPDDTVYVSGGVYQEGVKSGLAARQGSR